MILTFEEMEAWHVFEHEIERWREILMLDQIWRFTLDVLEDDELNNQAAAVDLSKAEYYLARIMVARSQLSLSGDELRKTAKQTACHELVHVLTTDYQRAALSATSDNTPMRAEMRYRYEQLTSRLTEALLELETSSGGENESAGGENPGTPEGMLRMSEMSPGGEDG